MDKFRNNVMGLAEKYVKNPGEAEKLIDESSLTKKTRSERDIKLEGTNMDII